MKKRIVILGGGESGVGAAILAKQQGYDVFLSDIAMLEPAYKTKLQQAEIAFEEGQHTASLILSANELIKSPGIPPTVHMLQQVLQAGIPVISEIEFAARYTQAKLIAVTGSNGKSTTCSLLYHILKQAGLNVALAGNIGHSFAELVATAHYEYYVLELSSFMLDDMHEFKADIAVLLNITPDHLDRYNHRMEDYVASKMRILQNQSADDVFIYCADDIEISKALTQISVKAQTFAFSIQKTLSKGAWLQEAQCVFQLDSNPNLIMSINELALQGKHNVYNSMASGIVASVLKLRNNSIRESLSDFQNIAHRLEFVAEISGIAFINDSKATNVNSTWFALESMNTKVVLILGGVDKGNDYDMLKGLVKEKVKAIVCLGRDNQRIHQAFENDVEWIVNAFSAQEAAEMAYHLAKKGDTVLLSPACASFDLFKNYEDRGEQFKKAVIEL